MTMTPALTTGTLTLMLAMSLGCSGDRAPTPAATARPEWIANPSMDGQFGAVGVAPAGLGGMQQALDQATASARAELARTLSVTVEAAYKDAFTSASDWKGKDVQATAHELSENVTHQVAGQVLVGSHRRDTWVDAGTGETYVWVVIERGSKLSTTVEGAATSALSEQGLQTSEVSQRLTADLERSLR